MQTTIEEKRVLRKKLVERLRDPREKQGVGRLERRNGLRCCLGVACRVFDEVYPNTLTICVIPDEYTSFDEERTALPTVVKEAFGFAKSNGAYDNRTNLVANNDTGMTFLEIADIIESEPPGMFGE